MRTGFLAKATAAFAAIAFAVAFTSAASFAASGFVGKWKTTDTEGKQFTIWLSDDGKAKGDRANEGLSGMWKEEGSAAVITWDSGWVTRSPRKAIAIRRPRKRTASLWATPRT